MAREIEWPHAVAGQGAQKGKSVEFAIVGADVNYVHLEEDLAIAPPRECCDELPLSVSAAVA